MTQGVAFDLSRKLEHTVHVRALFRLNRLEKVPRVVAALAEALGYPLGVVSCERYWKTDGLVDVRLTATLPAMTPSEVFWDVGVRCTHMGMALRGPYISQDRWEFSAITSQPCGVLSLEWIEVSCYDEV